jgi:hypothetical protein
MAAADPPTEPPVGARPFEHVLSFARGPRIERTRRPGEAAGALT